MRIFLFIIALSLNGCALFKPSPHNRMAKELRTYEYPLELAELKSQLIASLPALYSMKGPLLIFDADKDLPVVSPGARMNRAKAMDQGFTYKGRFYQNQMLEIDFSDLFRSDAPGHLATKLKDFFRNEDFHLLEDGPDHFLLVKGVDIYEGRKLGPGHSRLEVKEVGLLPRGPLRLSLDPLALANLSPQWWQVLKLSQDPIQLERALPHAVENPFGALRVFYFLRPEEAKAWEASGPPAFGS